MVAKLAPPSRSANILKDSGKGLSRGKPETAETVVFKGLPILPSAIILLIKWTAGCAWP